MYEPWTGKLMIRGPSATRGYWVMVNDLNGRY